MSSIAALPGSPRASARPRLELVRPGFRPRPRQTFPPQPVPRPARRVAPAVVTDLHPRAVAAPAARVRLTPRGRAVVAAVGVVVAGVLAAGVGTWAGHAVAAPPAPGPATTVTVTPGQTLWAIAAGAAAPGEDVRDVVDRLVALNGLDSGALRSGQQILVPAS